MLKFTLDTNCLYDLEGNRPGCCQVQQIVGAWKAGRIKLAAVGVTASENQKGGKVFDSYDEFEDLLKKVGLDGIEHLLPLFIWDFSYWDNALWVEDQHERLFDRISLILFPNFRFDQPGQDQRAQFKWRNKVCDILVAWSHAFHEWDVLVTRDDNFLKNRERLEAIGVRGIVDPPGALQLISAP